MLQKGLTVKDSRLVQNSDSSYWRCAPAYFDRPQMPLSGHLSTNEATPITQLFRWMSWVKKLLYSVLIKEETVHFFIFGSGSCLLVVTQGKTIPVTPNVHSSMCSWSMRVFSPPLQNNAFGFLMFKIRGLLCSKPRQTHKSLLLLPRIKSKGQTKFCWR